MKQTAWITVRNVSHLTTRLIFTVSRHADIVAGQVADATDDVLLRWNSLSHIAHKFTKEFIMRERPDKGIRGADSTQLQMFGKHVVI